MPRTENADRIVSAWSAMTKNRPDSAPSVTQLASTDSGLLARLAALKKRLAGELLIDELSRAIYATDASEYQEKPLAVALPESEDDIRELIHFAAAERVGLIPRAAGTSLAGQVVGNGIVVDAGRHLNQIGSYDDACRTVRVQPGVVRDALNRFLIPHKCFFAPETSTAAWAMIGGMVGNNSCGANSIAYGSTRDHLRSVRGFLADGSEVTFGPLSAAEFVAKCDSCNTAEARIYRTVRDLLGDAAIRQKIRDAFPRPEVTRRNTGYALDALLEASCFEPASPQPFNMCKLLAGSEGTLFFGVEFELNVMPLPPPGALLCLHCGTVDEALRATLVAMQHKPTACELIDKKILDCTLQSSAQAQNRSFLVGDPGAVLVVELRHADRSELTQLLDAVQSQWHSAQLGYACPVLFGAEGDKVWNLRRAGQGIVNNIPGAARPREIVEDTAVAVADLPAYIAEFDHLLAETYGIECIHYAHAGAGELHLRPLFDLRSPAGLKMFRDVATDVAALVKKYRGSLSGEHGDGRLRGEFIRTMVGDECFSYLQRIKRTFDPNGIFNPGKIIDAPPMDTCLRILPDESASNNSTALPETIFRFSESGGVRGAAEKCTGVGQCRSSHAVGGTMCPSYMATRDERDTTRARANMLRTVLAAPSDPLNPWNSPQLAEVMDLCLSCKGCKSECPSNVDMARLKSEWEQHWHDAHGVPLRSRVIAGFAKAMQWATRAPWLYNFVVQAPLVATTLKRVIGFAEHRSLPLLPKTTLLAWHRNRRPPARKSLVNGRVQLFCDEFTNTFDAAIGIKTVELLESLGYEVSIPQHVESGRAHISKGLLREARDLAAKNVELLAAVVSDEVPLVGIEPSAILSFRDEYPDLVPLPLMATAKQLAKQTFLIDEFLAREAAQGIIGPKAFTTESQSIKLHGHCHQKALSALAATVAMLSLPQNFSVEVIPSGCCGMAGSFGYEREHFRLSMQIGELVLFPAVRAAPAATFIAAPGTSCRHQIADATGRKALHPVEILHAALLHA